jgi:hypothetical protein
VSHLHLGLSAVSKPASHTLFSLRSFIIDNQQSNTVVGSDLVAASVAGVSFAPKANLKRIEWFWSKEGGDFVEIAEGRSWSNDFIKVADVAGTYSFQAIVWDTRNGALVVGPVNVTFTDPPSTARRGLLQTCKTTKAAVNKKVTSAQNTVEKKGATMKEIINSLKEVAKSNAKCLSKTDLADLGKNGGKAGKGGACGTIKNLFARVFTHKDYKKSSTSLAGDMAENLALLSDAVVDYLQCSKTDEDDFCGNVKKLADIYGAGGKTTGKRNKAAAGNYLKATQICNSRNPAKAKRRSLMSYTQSSSALQALALLADLSPVYAAIYKFKAAHSYTHSTRRQLATATPQSNLLATFTSYRDLLNGFLSSTPPQVAPGGAPATSVDATGVLSYSLMTGFPNVLASGTSSSPLLSLNGAPPSVWMNGGYAALCEASSPKCNTVAQSFSIVSSNILTQVLAAYPLNSSNFIPTNSTRVVSTNVVTVDFGAKTPASTGYFICPSSFKASACNITVNIPVDKALFNTTAGARKTKCLRLIDTSGWFNDLDADLVYNGYNAVAGTVSCTSAGVGAFAVIQYIETLRAVYPPPAYPPAPDNLCTGDACPKPNPEDAPLTENQQSVALTFQGADYASLANSPSVQAEYVTNIQKVIQTGLARQNVNIAATDSTVKKFYAGSVVSDVVITLPPGTSAAVGRALADALVAAINSGSLAFDAAFLARYGITGVSAKVTTPSVSSPSPSSSNNSLAIGLGVGLGVGLALILAIIAFVVIRHRKQVVAVSGSDPESPAGRKPHASPAELGGAGTSNQ